MNSSASRLFVATLLLALLVPCSAPGDSPKGKTLVDFTHEDIERRGTDVIQVQRYDFSYEKWQDKIVFLDRKGLLVPALPGDGGFGGNYRLAFGTSTLAEIDVVIGNRNESESFVFSLSDGDGTQVSWTLPLGGKPVGQKFSFVVSLDNPERTDNSGKKPGFDKSKIKRWEFKGNWQQDKLEVLLVRIGIPPPAPDSTAASKSSGTR